MIEGIKQAVREAGRSIDDDHYGAGFPFRFGKWDEAIVQRQVEAFNARMKREGHEERNARDYIAVGDAGDIVDHLRRFVAAGAFKFVLRPIADSDDGTMEQTRLLINEVLPEVYSDGFEASARS